MERFKGEKSIWSYNILLIKGENNKRMLKKEVFSKRKYEMRKRTTGYKVNLDKRRF